MPTYRTPGVYIEEISLFPPSVAEVETAIPAFIGYTARDTLLTVGDLVDTPRRIGSLLEFESLYGKGPAYTVASVDLDDAGNFLAASVSNSYMLYDSLRLFYDNGGGDCYIVSVGTYKSVGAPVDRDELKDGVKAVAKVDEPTILLFPDAATLSADDLAAVQQEALKQCGELKDRVAVLDLRQDDPNGDGFRDRIGINNLKYGAAYTPWLKLNYDKPVSYEQLRGKLRRNGLPLPLADLTSDPAILLVLGELEQLATDAATVNTAVGTLHAAGETLSAAFAQRLTAYKAIAAPTAADGAALFRYLYDIAKVIDGFVDASPLSFSALVTDINTTIGGTLVPAYRSLIALEKELAGAVVGYATEFGEDTPPASVAWNGLFGAGAPVASAGTIAGASDKARIDGALPGLQKAFSTAAGAIAGIVSGLANYRALKEQTLLDTFTPYRNAVKGVASTLTLCPPSGAIAGIYALVDSQRGVWKAPANVSLNGVIAPAVSFTASETDALNVDANAGKSINAICAFSGKGTLVWGARTLAGNDNEWRYISVRRFFNMVEESVKKSTYWAVFEPNDANTWVKVRGMIENYLTQKWREGALAGATTKDAFFVRCGLGVTMSAQDVLEGRMNVEIGMAAVRPAEFIVLKFSHKLQTS